MTVEKQEHLNEGRCQVHCCTGAAGKPVASLPAAVPSNSTEPAQDTPSPPTAPAADDAAPSKAARKRLRKAGEGAEPAGDAGKRKAKRQKASNAQFTEATDEVKRGERAALQQRCSPQPQAAVLAATTGQQAAASAKSGYVTPSDHVTPSATPSPQALLDLPSSCSPMAGASFDGCGSGRLCRQAALCAIVFCSSAT